MATTWDKKTAGGIVRVADLGRGEHPARMELAAWLLRSLLQGLSAHPPPDAEDYWDLDHIA